MTDDRFRLVGVRPQSPAAPVRRAPWYRGKPIFSAAVLTLIVLGCLFCEVLLTHDPTYLDLAHCNEAPSREFLFGTDPMGRDIFSMIWYGGRISLPSAFCPRCCPQPSPFCSARSAAARRTGWTVS